MKKITYFLILFCSLSIMAQQIEIIDASTKDQYEDKSYEVINSLKLLPGFKASYLQADHFFARMSKVIEPSFYPRAYTFVDPSEKIQFYTPGKDISLAEVTSDIIVIGSQSGKINGSWTKAGELFEFNPLSSFIQGEKITIRIIDQIHDSSLNLVAEPLSHFFYISPNAPSIPLNFGVQQKINDTFKDYIRRFEIADMDEDNAVDFIVISSLDGSIGSITMHRASNGFNSELVANIPDVGLAPTIFLSDLNNDELMDIVLIKNDPLSSNQLVTILNYNGSFSLPSNHTLIGSITTDGILQSWMDDLNHDGLDDIVLNTNVPSQEVYILENTNPGFINHQVGNIHVTGVFDFNEDGKPEIHGDGTAYDFDLTGNQLVDLNINYGAGNISFLTDWNGDYHPSIVTPPVWYDHNLTSYSQIGSPDPDPLIIDKSLNLNDLNGDKSPDLIVINQHYAGFKQFGSTGGLPNSGVVESLGSFLNTPTAVHPLLNVRYVDIDLDGDLDLVSHFEHQSGGTHLYWREHALGLNSINNLQLNSISATIDESNKLISVTIPPGFDKSNALIEFSLSPEAILQINGSIVSNATIIALEVHNIVDVIAEDGRANSYTLVLNYNEFGSDHFPPSNSISLTSSTPITITPNEAIQATGFENISIVGSLFGSYKQEGTWTYSNGDLSFNLDNGKTYHAGEEITVTIPSGILINATGDKTLKPKTWSFQIEAAEPYASTIGQPVTFSSLQTVLQNEPEKIVAKDLDKNNEVDIIYQEGNEIKTRTNLSGVFGPETTLASFGSSIKFVDVVDVDENGYLDILFYAGSNTGQLRCMFDDGTGNYTNELLHDFSITNENYGVYVRDHDFDGDNDIILRRFYLELLTKKTLGYERSIPDYNIRTEKFTTIDYDYDGDMDFLFNDFMQSGSPLLLAENKGAVLENRIINPSFYTDINYSLIAADLNNDGIMNVATRAQLGNNLFFYEAPDGSIIETLNYYPKGSSTIKGDFDGNSIPELLPLQHIQSKNTIAFDIDGDGDIDVWSKNGWYENEYNAAEIESFEVSGVQGLIDYQAKTISIIVPANTNLSNVVPTIQISQGATIELESGGGPEIDLTPFNPVNYIVTAKDEFTSQVWQVILINETFEFASVSPDLNATNVSPQSDITVTFSEPIDPTTFANDDITIYGSIHGNYTGSWMLSPANDVATFTSSTDFISGEKIILIKDGEILNSPGDKTLKTFHTSFDVASPVAHSSVTLNGPQHISSVSLAGPGYSSKIYPVQLDDSDTKVDLIIRNGDYTVFASNTSSTSLMFSQTNYYVNSTFSQVIDYDNDGFNELVVSQGVVEYDNGSVTMNPFSSPFSGEFFLFDVNGNGELDYYLRNSGAHFDLDFLTSPNQQFLHESGGPRPGIADLNNDGIFDFYDGLEVYSYNYETNNLNHDYSRSYSYYPAPANFNNDNILDYATIRFSGTKGIVIEFNSLSNGNISTSQSELVSMNASFNIGSYDFIDVGDIDGDGLDEIVYAFSNSGIVGWIDVSESGSQNHTLLDGVSSPGGIKLVDLDADLDLDIVFTYNDSGERKLYWFENTGIAPPPVTSTIEDDENISVILGSDNFELILYPNPSDNYLQLIGNINNTSVSIYDLRGNEIKRIEKIDSSAITIDTSDIMDGVYIIKIKSESGKLEERKLVIKH